MPSVVVVTMTPEVDEGGCRPVLHGNNHENMPRLHTRGSRKGSEGEANHDPSIDLSQETPTGALHKAHPDSLRVTRPAGKRRCPIVRGASFHFQRMRCFPLGGCHSQGTLPFNVPDGKYTSAALRPLISNSALGSKGIPNSQVSKSLPGFSPPWVATMSGMSPVLWRRSSGKRTIVQRGLAKSVFVNSFIFNWRSACAVCPVTCFAPGTMASKSG